MKVTPCISCEEPIPLAEGRRGRLPHFCEACRGNPQVIKARQQASQEALEAKAVETVNRLEHMLKSRGTHISQYRGLR